jgi:hypothetical protein
MQARKSFSQISLEIYLKRKICVFYVNQNQTYSFNINKNKFEGTIK